MGADIHTYVEIKNENGTWQHPSDVRVLEDQNYGVFGFLADVRNFSVVPVIAEPRGLPDDISWDVIEAFANWYGDAHTPSWLSREELLNFDYDQIFENRREKIGPEMWSGETVEIGQGEVLTYREFLPDTFFEGLEQLASIKADHVRLVFWFDN